TGELRIHDIVDSNNGNNKNTNESNKRSDHHTMERLTKRIVDITNPSRYNGLEASIMLMKGNKTGQCTNSGKG
ncbi:MAG: hypothetical protein ACC656_05180, partial [Candidatus Heimdallarchaeota archaeon]